MYRNKKILKKGFRKAGVVAVLLLFVFSNKITAQVNPPDFLCVRSDTLYWNVPVNTCGSFNNYTIYFSMNPNGPFSLLTTITNQGQNLYPHPNPFGDTWYYYMESDFNCPGEPVLQSDTLNNLSPEVATIKSVSVNGNSVELEWLSSPSPETSGYIIFRNTPLGTTALDTVYGMTSYVDNTASPNTQSETYFVIALDECGNTSIFDAPHSTLLLMNEVSGCEQSIILKWNLYQNWVNGIGSQEVWVGVNGDPSVLVETLSSTDTNYVFRNATDSDEYCFFIKAKEAVTGFNANSNQICLIPDLVNAMRNLFLKNVSVLPNGSVELTWNWEANAEIQSVEILQSTDNQSFNIESSLPAVYPLGNGSSFISIGQPTSQQQLFYKIQTTDDCDSLALSNYGSTILLTGTAQPGLLNEITWTDFDFEGATVSDYDIYRIVGGSEIFLENVPAGTNLYSDPVDPAKEEESNVCYYVVANSAVELPDGNIQPIESRSNLVCVEQLTSILTPNAFAPQGRNQIFRPTVIFGETVDFQMVIYNRWGEILFESQNKEVGWNGKFKGRVQPMGSYVYQVKITQASGRVVEKQGVFVLLR